jgi:hypothetical protein
MLNKRVQFNTPWIRLRSITFSLAMCLLMIAAGCGSGSTQTPAQPTTGAIEPSPTPVTPTASVPTPAPTMPSPTATSEAVLPAGWTAYTSQRCEYALSFPAEMQVTSETAYSSLFKFDMTYLGEGTPNFIYVSVIDQDDPSLNAEDIYNYAPAEADRLINLQVGESSPLNDFEQMAPYITYQRLPDTTISGYKAKTYENVKPWEFPEGTKEIRYYLSSDGCLYQIGGYMDTTQSGQAGFITEDLFHQIVDTFHPMP